MQEANPGKPDKPEKFKKPVVWLLGRQLIASLKGVALFAAFKGKLDLRDWMKAKTVDLSAKDKRINKGQPETEFWFDYISDTGDGQRAAYSIAYLCLSDLWTNRATVEARRKGVSEDAPRAGFDFNKLPEHNLRLPRGEFLYVGGDTSYHIADYINLASRFQSPFRWAFEDVKSDLQGAGKEMDETRRPMFGIPGNHDYYDMIDGFNRQFRQPISSEDAADNSGNKPQLSIPGFNRLQQASYVSIKLPFEWWLWGLDIEVGRIDARQREFFLRQNEGQQPKKLIITTPEPSTVLGKRASADSPIAEIFNNLKLAHPFLHDGFLEPDKCRVDLSGDTHHYARYWGPQTGGGESNYASVVSGLGGAFHHPSTTDFNEVDERALYPAKKVSREAVAEEIFNFWKLFEGGYLWLFGGVMSAIIYFAATVPASTKPLFDSFIRLFNPQAVNSDSGLPSLFPKLPATVSAGCSFLLPAVLALVFIAASLIGVLLSSREIDKKKSGPSPGDQDESLLQQVKRERKKLLGWWGLVTLSSIGLFTTLVAFRNCRAQFSSFASSLLILASFIVALLAVVESAFYSEWLVRKARKVSIRESDYWPVGVLNAVAAVIICAGLLLFGTYPAAYLISDIVFAVVVLTAFIGLILLSVLEGAGMHKAPSKFLFALIGLWYVTLQLLTPFLLVRSENLLVLIAVVILLTLFRWLGIAVVKWKDKMLAPVWFLYGYLILALPVLALMKPTLVPGSFASVPYPVKLVAAALVGALMTHVWIGWYFAVSLAFNGHNSLAGGAARIERFKQFIRFRLTADTLTGYVIAVDDPKSNGRELEPKIVDVFTLKCSK